MAESLLDEKIELLSRIVRDIYGLKFSQDRWGDLRSAVAKVSSEIGKFNSEVECLDYLLSPQAGEKEFELFINQLTIGETYFFRDPTALEALEREVLPKMNGKGSGRSGAVRIWSMACATGEEPYTLAMICSRSHIASEIFGTDIDSEALTKARKACYRKWAFRVKSNNFKDVYFKQDSPNSFQLNQSIKDMVHFSRLNLIGDALPISLCGMDVVMCRNVLIYFSEEGVKLVLDKIWESLNYNGWLIVTPSESALVTSHGRFEPVNVGSVLLFRKNKDYSATNYDEKLNNYYKKDFAENYDSDDLSESDNELNSFVDSYSVCDLEINSEILIHDDSESYPTDYLDDACDDYTQPDPLNSVEEACALKECGDNAGALSILKKTLEESLSRSEKAKVLFTIAGIQADSGLLDEAVLCCGKSIEADRVAPEPHFLMGQIKLNKNDLDAAVRELRNAIFLDSSFIMAHFVLGNIYLSQNDKSSALRHLRISLQELGKIDKDTVVPHSGGTTAGRCIEMIKVVKDNIC